MLKQHSSFLRQTIAVIDCSILLFSFISSHWLISAYYRNLSPIQSYWLMFVGFMGFYLYFAWTRQLFSILRFVWLRGILRRTVMIFVSAGVLGAAILYMVPDISNSRVFYTVFVLHSFVLILMEKTLLKVLIEKVRRNNKNTTPVIIFGRGRKASRIIRDIIKHPEWGIRIVKKQDINISPSDFEEILKNRYVEEIFFFIPRSISNSGFRLDPYLKACEEMGRTARVFMNLSNATFFSRWEYHTFLERPTFISHTAELDPDQVLFKRLFDITGALVGAGFLVILWLPITVVIKLTSRGPVLFRQIRVGKNGKRFIMYKFRSMYAGADAEKRLLQKKNEMNGAVFKMKQDPRVTWFGRFLRCTSLDELPQFINVLKGDMSLVGARPPTPDEVKRYKNWHFRRLSTTPGMSGLWQVSGRNKVNNFDDIVKLDLNYIDSWSIWLDLKIILKTLNVVFRRGETY